MYVWFIHIYSFVARATNNIISTQIGWLIARLFVNVFFGTASLGSTLKIINN